MKRKAKMTKMGRPRTDEKVIRVARGVRLNPDLLKRVDRAIADGGIIGGDNFSAVVEIGLKRLLVNTPY